MNTTPLDVEKRRDVYLDAAEDFLQEFPDKAGICYHLNSAFKSDDDNYPWGVAACFPFPEILLFTEPIHEDHETDPYFNIEYGQEGNDLRVIILLFAYYMTF
jgi:hypothetical protein